MRELFLDTVSSGTRECPWGRLGMFRAFGRVALGAQRGAAVPTPSVARLPGEHREALLERLRAPGATRCRDPLQRRVRIEPVPHEPATNDDARSPAPCPAVEVDDAAGLDLLVDGVERRDQLFPRRNGEIANGRRNAARRGMDEVRVGLELAFLRQVDEERDALPDQIGDRLLSLLEAVGARMPARDEARLDGRRRAHRATECARAWLCLAANSSEGPASSLSLGAADTGPVARLESPTHALRDRALVLSAELGVDPTAWYLRVLESSRVDGEEPDLGALVRAYWELQRVSGRADLRTEWRRLADLLWAA
jgi:hypothetical protein